MTKKTTVLLSAIVPLLGGGLWFYGRADGSERPAYRTATVDRSDIEAAVSATGKLGAVTTVQVGTQVSGQISAILVDFNDRVTKGQLIARIDPTLQQQTVRDAQAGVERNLAELENAQRDYDRNKSLHDSKVITDSEFGTAVYKLAVARANVKSAQVTLDRARQNLSYTSIFAPISGIVVERNVDVGQTVAASLSAPQLFLIAQDLSRMQILASVDESDIGAIREGLPVKFTVQAYPSDTFVGTVKQVRLQSTTTENVVNYTAVVEVNNPQGKLLPGMTATADFVTGSATNILTVPNAALRFRPAEGAIPAARGSGDSTRRGVGAAQASANVRGAQGVARGGRPGGAGSRRSANTGMLWILKDGKVTPVRVRTGLTDGQRTQVEGRDLVPGMMVIIGTQAAGPASAATASPFAGAANQGGRPPRPGGF